MPEFKSAHSYSHFESRIKNSTRYIRDSETDDFLATVLATSQKRLKTYKSGTTLWRAQLGNDYAEDGIILKPVAYEKLRMKPLNKKAKEGRLNPKGIPVLYLSTEQNTAMAEVRPWIGSFISLARFILSSDQNIIDCSDFYNITPIPVLLNFNLTANQKENNVWNDINRAFSMPVTNSDDTADYAPTQIIAELFKEQGYDGVAYKSALGGGLNLVLFDIDSAYVAEVMLYKVENISFKFAEDVTSSTLNALRNFNVNDSKKP